MSIIRTRMPLLARHEGTWAGTYRFITPQMTLLDQHDFRIVASFPEDGRGGVTYRQDSVYRWPDGRTRELRFEGVYDNGRVVFDGRIAGSMRELDERTLYLHFWFADQPGVDVLEAIHLAPNNADRARTWHWFKDQKLFQLTLVDEHRVT